MNTTRLFRRSIAACAGVMLSISGAFGQEAPWPTGGWVAANPAAHGLDAAPLEGLDARIRAGDFGYIDRLVVVRDGFLVVDERYAVDYEEVSRGRTSAIGCGFGCSDPSWDHQFNYLHPDWHPYYQGRDVHTLQSVTKSVSATLIGVAIERGEIVGVDVPILPFLVNYDLSDAPSGLHEATLDDLLTMRTGIEWHETDRPMDDSNTTILLERSDDWVQFTLRQPMDAAPGEKWAYNSGGSQLMSAILKASTGQTMDQYAEDHLFGPLGIDDFFWKITPAGLPDALGGLYLEALDLAKIGYLYLKDGVWHGRRILPEGWVRAATSRRVESPGYGYQWWRPDPGGVEVWAGQGFGGQFLLVLPAYDVVAVINSWNQFGGRPGNLRDALVAAVVESLGGTGPGR
ncbi:MAG: beta-lactamase family protein [Gemmatimonadota bacterium]|nr:beta-lactamase family protein [Gemmatimonadota bacterium]